MLVFISSTSKDLQPYRDAAADVVHQQGRKWKAYQMEHFGTHGQKGVVDQLNRRVQESDLVIALIAWRRGFVPSPDRGGDGQRSCTAWELQAAESRSPPVPVLVFMADKNWPGRLWEDDPEARQWVKNFRNDLDRLAKFFRWEDVAEGDPEPLPLFRAKVMQEIAKFRGKTEEASPTPSHQLREWKKPTLPAEPYPLLLPYEHPELFAGRNREQAAVLRELARPASILGLFSASGAGKSSLLRAGLLPALREAGVPVSLDRQPHEPSLTDRLVSDLLTGIDELPSAEDFASFVKLVRSARDMSRRAPVLMLDQFESVIRQEEGASARALVGILLAATSRRQPGLDGPLCRWVLSYRGEYHGDVVSWLRDVLQDARRRGMPGIESLPHDLSSLDRFNEYPLPPLGRSVGSAYPVEDAKDAFLEAIKRPLDHRDANGRPSFAWRFAGDGAERLAAAFARARQRAPLAPLVPELQVVLAHLLDRAVDATTNELVVPEELQETIDLALERHVQRVLVACFPKTTRASRQQRAKTLLALRELATAAGERSAGLSDDDFAEILGVESARIIERLQDSRILLRDEDNERWALSHDSMARVIVQTVDEQKTTLMAEVDPKLLRLRRLVGIYSDLYQYADAREQSVRLKPEEFRTIAANVGSLLRSGAADKWWAACKRYSEIRPLLEADPDLSFETLMQLPAARLANILWAGGSLFEMLERSWRRPQLSRAKAVPAIVSAATPLPKATALDTQFLGLGFWMLDYLRSEHRRRGDHDAASYVAKVRAELVSAVRTLRPLPEEVSKSLKSDYVEIPSGEFRMGGTRGSISAQPIHNVQLPAFRLGAWPVRNQDFLHFDSDWIFPAAERGHPAVNISWYQAYAYASWLGGRLPTEAEWEYACRAGSETRYWSGDEVADLGRIGWYEENSNHRTHDVAEKEANPWGLFDLHGHVLEWVADWYEAGYANRPVESPNGPVNGSVRVGRGGSFKGGADDARSAFRGWGRPDLTADHYGFRVRLPSDAPALSGL